MFTRSLIVLLLVLNLGVAAWWSLRPAPAAPPAPAQPEGVPRLQLVGEAGSPPTPHPAPAPAPPSQQPAQQESAQQEQAVAAADTPAAEAAAPPAAPQQSPRCFAFGPFADQAAADAARTALQPRATRVQSRTEAAPTRGGHWDVLLPPQADRAAAQAMAQRIEAAGFKDYYVIGEGASANGIALGRFGSEASARRHQAALQQAGFATQVQGPPAATRIWLDVVADAGFDADAARRAASAARVQPAECGAPG